MREINEYDIWNRGNIKQMCCSVRRENVWEVREEKKLRIRRFRGLFSCLTFHRLLH